MLAVCTPVFVGHGVTLAGFSCRSHWHSRSWGVVCVEQELDEVAGDFGARRDDRVAKGFELIPTSNQSSGKPISQATKCGLSRSWHGPPCVHVIGGWWPRRQVASVKLVPGCAAVVGLPIREPLEFASDAVAVGHNAAAVTKLIPVVDRVSFA
jgi:hypothetical protein